MTIQEFNKSFKMLLDYYPNTKTSPGMINLYFAGLSDLTVKELNKAIARIVKDYDSDFLPKVPVILKYARQDNGEIDIETQIVLAVKLLKHTVVKHGRYKSIAFRDKGIQAVVDAVGGWTRLCDMELVEFNNLINYQFSKIYKAQLETNHQTSDYYVGIHDFENGTKNINLIDYAEIGVTQGIKINQISYNPTRKEITGLNKLKNKMLVGSVVNG